MIKVQKSKLLEKLELVPLNQMDNYVALVDIRFCGDWLHLRRRTGKRTIELTTLEVIMLKEFFPLLCRDTEVHL